MAKRITLYGIFTCLALIFGYIESLFSLSFIAPGIKLGLANCICLLLIASGDIRGALLVNITRVTLSALLFSTPFALLFSLSAGVISTLAAFALSRFKAVTAVGCGIGGALGNGRCLPRLRGAKPRFARNVPPVLLLLDGAEAVARLRGLRFRSVGNQPRGNRSGLC